jgi:rSAM/selenodomain-associated transferase 1
MRTTLIFIKNPELGKAKTRLAATVGAERALSIYRQLLAHTRRVVRAVEARRLLYYSRFVDTQDEWSAAEFDKRLQVAGDLGLRMQQAFAEAFAEGGGPVLIIGSDCAELSPAIIEEAFRQLETHDIVIGPARDGGYYLLGMRTFTPAVFQDMEWSTAEVLQQTLARIPEGHSYFLLPTLSDVDTEADWLTYGSHLRKA